ncbi:MAG: glycosyltransferase family A protein [Microbacteriaceae bacterium]|nr:glycosyltransferase family A protein [Microbacteriaceae bacterium]
MKTVQDSVKTGSKQNAKNPKISVIVPVYNTENYLALCLKTILDQDFRDFEVICVNDGSPDNSAELLAFAADSDERVRVIEKVNGGLSSARNAGIDAARGEIIMFVDSDDYLKPGALGTVATAFKRKKPDILVFGADPFPEILASDWLLHVLRPRTETFEGFTPKLATQKSASPFVWRSAVTREFLDRTGLRFDEELLFGEDQLWFFQAFPRSRRTCLIKNRLYAYRLNRPDSLMSLHNKDQLKRAREHLSLIRKITADWQQLGILERYSTELLYWSLSFIAGDMQKMFGSNHKEMRNGITQLLSEFYTKEMIVKGGYANRQLLSRINGSKATLSRRLINILHTSVTNPFYIGWRVYIRLAGLLTKTAPGHKVINALTPITGISSTDATPANIVFAEDAAARAKATADLRQAPNNKS